MYVYLFIYTEYSKLDFIKIILENIKSIYTYFFLFFTIYNNNKYNFYSPSVKTFLSFNYVLYRFNYLINLCFKTIFYGKLKCLLQI